jgi:hypothetical protein
VNRESSIAFLILAGSDRPLLPADCHLNLRGRVGGTLGQHRSLRQDVKAEPERKRVTLEMSEQSGKVIENKGLLWKRSRQSWNVHENTGT